MQSVIGVLCADKTFIGGIAVRTEISYRSAYNADEMQDGINKPIFIVGSPRSGTSILSRCLGQHPNIIEPEQSGWMGDLAMISPFSIELEPRAD